RDLVPALRDEPDAEGHEHERPVLRRSQPEVARITARSARAQEVEQEPRRPVDEDVDAHEEAGSPGLLVERDEDERHDACPDALVEAEVVAGGAGVLAQLASLRGADSVDPEPEVRLEAGMVVREEAAETP